VNPARKCLSGGLVCAVALFASSGVVRAQQSGFGTLTGTVLAASTRAPIAGAVVTATSRQLQGAQVVTTDATGTYRLPQLPPGVYTVRFQKDTYRTASVSDVALNADQTLRINAALLPEAP